MTKVFRNIFISLIGVFAFLFAGFFFVGCGVDYSKISLTCDKPSIELDVGESEDITFTIEGFQSGFSNQVQVNPRADGQTAVFEVSQPFYVGNNQIRVTVTGLAGGHGQLQVVTLEGRKECVVDVRIQQYSHSVEYNNNIAYVSNKTSFVPSSDLFTFDNNTTYTDLSYYYLQVRQDINFNTYTLSSLDLESGNAIFSNGVNTLDANITQFDEAILKNQEDGNHLMLSLDGQLTEVDLSSQFTFLAVYNYSVDNPSYENIVYDVASVYVLPDIDVNVTGGYVDINTGAVDFQPLDSDEIVIVPNNTNMLQFLLRVQMNDAISGSPLKLLKTQSNEFVDVDFYDYIEETEPEGTVFYLKISQNSQVQTSTNVSLEIFYDIAQEIDDESVNVKKDFRVNIEVAPTALTVNGTSEPERFVLYNYYRFPEFGWNEILVDVISGYATSPNYEGVYFTFDDTYLDLIYNNTTVVSGDSRLYTDLSTPFYIRGKYGTHQIADLVVTVHLKSDILQNADELTLDLHCRIIAGATAVSVSENYDEPYFYLDYDAGTVDFDGQIYADQAFQSVSYRFLSGVDVLQITSNQTQPYTQIDNRYYLNLSLTPRLAGVGIYRIYLDNGMPIELTFNVTRTLKPETTSIQLTNEGNEAVTEATYSTSDHGEFQDTLNIEILNPSSQTDISFGNVAQLTITANVNADSITYVPNMGGYVTVARINNVYRISTLANGQVQITFTLSGIEVYDFRTTATELELYVNVSSYSLVDEFYMRNGDNYALNNIVYYGSGNLQDSDESVTLTPVVNNVNSYNFYKYYFRQDAFVDIFANALESNEEGRYTYDILDDQVYSELVFSRYNASFIYFYAQVIYSQNGNNTYSTVPTVTEVTVTRSQIVDGRPQREEKVIMLVLNDGLMFYADDFEYVDIDAGGAVSATYTVDFSNIFSIDVYGSFDMENFTYTNNYQAIYNLSLNANLRQRNSTKRYDCRIQSSLYQSVESISLATSLTQLNFSNDTLSFNIGVYTYPTTSTNKNVRVEFVRTNGNPYVNMVTWTIDTSESDIGIYTIDLSCEGFYNQYRDSITTIDDYLTGRIYIYPAEWGDSYSSISADLHPIVIDVQYRNGSRANPYLLETVEDVLGINANQTTLRSHYEISTVIDMSTVQNFTPIGILRENGENVLYGFSGSIVGTSSQAAITNIAVSANNFSAVVNKTMAGGDVDILYTGFIAQLNSAYNLDANDPNSLLFTPTIENVSFSGEFNLDSSVMTYASILTSVNNGKLVNVGVRVGSSQISMTQSQTVLYFGAVSAVNYGTISQDFTKYDGTGYVFKNYNDKTRYEDENGNYYVVDDNNQHILVDSENYAIDENGNRLKFDEYGELLSEKKDYTGQNSKNLAYFEGVVNINAGASNVYAGGIAGASSGVVQRISSSTLKMYGYSAYSAYTLITISGTSSFTNFDRVYVGGAVGALTYNSGFSIFNEILVDTGTPRSGNTVQNLLMGGEIDTSGTVDYDDAVGGIVGFADTQNISQIDVLQNTSRVFLRANEYVGGIMGYDTYSVNYSVYTNFGTENVIEAVDDGRNNFYASAIIKFKTLTDLPEDTDISRLAFYAVGNSTRNARNYSPFVFGAYSYLIRNLLSVDKDYIVITNSASVNDYFGDYIILNTTTDGSLHIDSSYTFTFKEVELNLAESEFAMSQLDGNDVDAGVYFMYYFSVEGRVDGGSDTNAQDAIEDLNFVNPNSNFYPFSLGNTDVNISSSSSNILSVDVNGNLTVKGTGLATITLNSILNVVRSRVIYIYIVNFFDKDVSSSIFYTSQNINGVNITDDSILNIYGNSNTNVHVVPTYNLTLGVTTNGDEFYVTNGGVLNFNNVNYNLSKNTQIKVTSPEKIDYVPTRDTAVVVGKEYFVFDEESGRYVLVENPTDDDIATYFEQDYFSSVQLNGQTIIFYKNSNANPQENDRDNYCLTPVLQVTIQIGTERYTFVYELENSKIDVGVSYRDAATSIRTNSTYHSMQTNNNFSDTVTVISTNEEELVFYQIFNSNGELVQDRLPADLTQFDTAQNRENAWLDYINTMHRDDLFNLRLSRIGGNVFDLDCQIYTAGDKFLNRFEENIYGEYTVHLYCSELETGVSYSFKILLDEAEVNYISINNYSNFNDVSVPDEIVVPSQRGMLEITVDPVEAVFDEFVISNNGLNYQEGATEATFTFAYEKINADASKEFVLAQNFGRYENGELHFTYQEMTEFFAQLNQNFENLGENSSVAYTGKVYISYYMPSYNVDDEVAVGFDVNVTYGNEGQLSMPSTILLQTHLGSFAQLTFANKEEVNGAYFVARGLSYQMNLDYYGFSEDQIEISSTNSFVANVEKVGDVYMLNVTSESINYTGDVGYMVQITTVATKTVDNVLVTATDTLTIYVMEYVMNYSYVPGVNEDIVLGMEDGVISDAIGNPYTLQFNIRAFLEYDQTNAVVNTEVENFINSMTSNITWTVYLNDQPTVLEQGKEIRTDFYAISSFVVTPLRIYEAESDIYYFSASANYTIRNGIYAYSEIATNAYPIYTEFSFDVHQQSTEDSPIPVEDYDDFMDMQDGEWYILLNNIVIPSTEYAESNGIDQFVPIDSQIAGLDGNGYQLQMSGTYTVSGASSFGIFESVADDTILQNISIALTSDVVIRIDSTTFSVGLLTPQNNGIITNCEVFGVMGDEGLSVVCLSSATNSYVAGLVANNTGYITNSRSKINIFSNVNLSGFVGQNSGIIASSYYSEASLLNETNTTSEYTAGFVIENSGEIYTSYVSGRMSNNRMFYDQEDNTIQSSNNISGFVYTNSGSVQDCYSNIQLRQSGAFASGFVFENTGLIERCFSTSVLESEQTSNYGFARYNNVTEDAGNGIYDCYYLEDSDINNGGEIRSDLDSVNVSIGQIVLNQFTEITPLTYDEFGEDYLDEYFSSYVVAQGRDINSVWFFNTDSQNLSNFNGSVFNVGRIELVAPNIVADSQRQLERIETVVDETTGATSARYIYSYTTTSSPLGSVYNPILISDAETMENYILQENNNANYNYSYYRLIADIDYGDYIYNSSIFRTRFMGYLEGNFMTISGMSLVSSESMSSAGLFAQVGSSSILDAVGTVMNFTFVPQAVSFANTNVVGALAGIVDNGKIYNVTLDRDSSSQIIVVGNNIVGGAVGLTLGRYDIQDLYSNYSAKARHQSVAGENNFNLNVPEYSAYSFAGSLIGAASGMGDIYNTVTDQVVSVLGDKAGLVFGLIDENANVSKVLIEMQDGMMVNAYSYGGLVVGESKGQVSDVQIVGTESAFTEFRKIPSMPIALGGYAGLVNGGRISDLEMTQSISISTQSANTGVSYLGGVAGMLSSSTTLSNITVSAELTGFAYVGGVVGALSLQSSVAYFENLDINVTANVIGHRMQEVGIGGVVGISDESSVVDITSTIIDSVDEDGANIYRHNQINLVANANVYIYGTELHIYVGGIVGSNISLATHAVEWTDMSVTSGAEGIVANDMSNPSELATTSAFVTITEEDENPTLQIERIDGYQTIYATAISVDNVRYYCNVSFTTARPEEGSESTMTLRLNLYGSPYIPSDED